MVAWTYLSFLSLPHTEESASVLWNLRKEAENTLLLTSWQGTATTRDIWLMTRVVTVPIWLG